MLRYTVCDVSQGCEQLNTLVSTGWNLKFAIGNCKVLLEKNFDEKQFSSVDSFKKVRDKYSYEDII